MDGGDKVARFDCKRFAMPTVQMLNDAFVLLHASLFGGQSPELQGPKLVKLTICADRWYVTAADRKFASEIASDETMLFVSEDISTLWHATATVLQNCKHKLYYLGYAVDLSEPVAMRPVRDRVIAGNGRKMVSDAKKSRGVAAASRTQRLWPYAPPANDITGFEETHLSGAAQAGC